MNGAKLRNQNIRLVPTVTALALAAAVLTAVWIRYSGEGSDDGRPPGTAADATAAVSMPIPGDRSRVEICVDSAASTVSRTEAHQLVDGAVRESRNSRPEIWVQFFTPLPVVSTGCPVPVISFSPEEVIHHRVDKASEPLLFVFVQPEGIPVQGGFARRPYEMIGGLNSYEATTILFVDVATLLNPALLQTAVQDALGLGWSPANNPDGPPDPNATKPADRRGP